MKLNYQQMLEKVINYNIENNVRPKLLLHSCCAPCSSYCLEYLVSYFDITLYFYNPNITSEEEYIKRADELKRLVKEMGINSKVKIIVEEYGCEEFYRISKGLENEPERGRRCLECFELRLDKTANYAKRNDFDYFTTTLTISPHKNADLLNAIGEKKGKEYNVDYLFSDFKKKNGYKRSIELSTEYNLYRQDFCGCIYSKK